MLSIKALFELINKDDKEEQNEKESVGSST